jgi:Flp pilus assembly protein TadG
VPSRAAGAFLNDCSGISATEFAFIVPLMLMMFFGTVEFSSGVAIDRKVSLMARTLSNLTSQAKADADTDLTTFFAATCAIMTPYDPTLTKSTISELYVDPSTLQAQVEWSRSATVDANCNVTLRPGHTAGSPIPAPFSFPSQLAVGGTYLIVGEISYLYKPTIAYGLMPNGGVTLSDTAFTMPRQSTCVFYPSVPSPATCPTTSTTRKTKRPHVTCGLCLHRTLFI